MLNDTSARGTVTIAWDDNDNFETKLEKIITQKWIGIYPDGEEAWEFVVQIIQSSSRPWTILAVLVCSLCRFAVFVFLLQSMETNNANVTAAATLLVAQIMPKSNFGGTRKAINHKI